METLKKELNNVIEQIKNSPFKNNEEIEYFSSKLKNIKTEEWSNSDFILASIRLRNEENDFEKTKSDIENLKNDLNESSLVSLSSILRFVISSNLEKDSKDKQMHDVYWEYIKYGEENGIWQGYSTLVDPFLRSKEKFTKLIRLFYEYNLAMLPSRLLNLESYRGLCKDGLIGQVLAIARTGHVSNVTNIKSAKKTQKDLDVAYELKRLSKSGDLSNLIEDVKEIDTFVFLLSSYINKLEKQQRNKTRENNKNINLYEELLNKIYSLQVIRKKDIEFIENEDLKQQIVYKVIENNKNNYLDLKQRYKMNKKYEVNEFDKLLLSYNIKLSDEYHKTILIKSLSIDDVRIKLDILSSKELDFITKDETKLTKILLFSNNLILEKIKYLVEKEVITIDFLKDNLDILISENNDLSDELQEVFDKSLITCMFDKFNNNVELFRKYNIPITNIKKHNINLFLVDTENIKTVLDLVKRYGLNLNSNDLTDFTFLTDIKKINMVDSFIELGMFDYLKNHISLINADINLIKKIMILQSIGYKEFDNDNTLYNLITTSNRFYIEDDKLDLYISNDVTDYLNLDCYIALEECKNLKIDRDLKHTFIISVLDSLYKLDFNTYKIDNVLISRNKVLRNMTTLSNYDFDSEVTEKEKLYTAIFYNSILSKEKIISIIDDIDKNIEITEEKIKIKKN